MKEHLGHLLAAFMGFFAVMNPIANTPIFLGLTSGSDAATRRAVARNALILTLVVVVAFSATGRLIFELFGITLIAFRIAGGAIVFLIGLHMLGGETSSAHRPSAEDQQASREARLSVAVSPLAIPILAGPGTIVTAVNFVGDGDVLRVGLTAAAFALLCVISYVFFVSGARLVKYIGQSAVNAITRLMGLILAVIGTQLALDGITSLVASLKG